MNTKEKDLRDKMGKAHSQMQDVARKLKEGIELNADEQKQFEQWDKDYEKARQELTILQRANELEAVEKVKELEGIKGGEKEVVNLSAYERKAIFTKGMEKPDALSSEEKEVYKEMKRENQAFVKLIANGELTEAERASLQRAQSAGTTTAGGFSIPQGFLAKIDAKLKYISPFFSEMTAQFGADAENIFEVLRTTTGNDLPFPTNDDTATVGELLAENGDAFANAADLTFGQVTMKAYKYSSKPMKVSNELLNDTGVDLESYIANALATRIARIVNTQFTTGDNSSKPQGIVIGATAGKTTAASAAITFPEILDLLHSVDPSYRMSPSARFMFHDNILLYLKKLTIGSATNDSRPVWQPGYSVGAPDTIDGFKYLINQDMASTLATTNITMLFGDMKKYFVRLVGNYAIKRLDERFADADQTAWLLFLRADGRYANTAAIKKMTQV
jgi:HK97 family phage major capsid protein